MLSKYLIIGLIIQIIIIIEKVLRKQIYDDSKFGKTIEFYIGVISVILIGSIINIVLWPIAILAEIYNIIEEES